MSDKTKIDDLTNARGKQKLEHNKYIYLKSPAGKENCDYGHGMPECIFKISKKEWIKMGKFIHKNESKYKSIKQTTSDDCELQICVLHIDYIDIYENTIILKKNEIPKDFKNISSDKFIYFIRDMMEYAKQQRRFKRLEI